MLTVRRQGQLGMLVSCPSSIYHCHPGGICLARPQFHYRWFSQCAGAIGGVARERGVIKNALVSATRSFFFYDAGCRHGNVEVFLLHFPSRV